jgi:hypothetical protein
MRGAAFSSRPSSSTSDSGLERNIATAIQHLTNPTTFHYRHHTPLNFNNPRLPATRQRQPTITYHPFSAASHTKWALQPTVYCLLGSTEFFFHSFFLTTNECFYLILGFLYNPTVTYHPFSANAHEIDSSLFFFSFSFIFLTTNECFYLIFRSSSTTHTRYYRSTQRRQGSRPSTSFFFVFYS